MTQVALPWMPIFSSIEPHDTALRAPSVPSGFGITFGTTNNDSPRVPSGAPSMLAGGDEDFRAGYRVAAVRLPHRFGADEAEIGAALRLGQVHRAGPFAGDH